MKKIRITDSEMTRFNITMDNALDLIINTAKIGKGKSSKICGWEDKKTLEGLQSFFG